MSNDYPERFPATVNPWRLAEGQQSLAGSIPLCQLQRLCEFLHFEGETSDAVGKVRFDARFGKGSNRRPVLRLRVMAELPMLCQRSLKVYSEKIDREIELTLIDAEANREGRENFDDGTDTVLVNFKQMALAVVVEDELLMSLPLIAVNPKCPLMEYHSEDKNYTEPEQKSPFAALAKLR
ncbi:MAG: YceD family protein [Xanthomonadales bacterium]|nr:YceD family protein [Xanthomonadales bacterium]